MECTNIKQFLSEYLDSALDEDRKNLVEEHLSTCQKCSQELETLRTYVRALNSLEGVKAPDNFLEKVHGRLQRRWQFKGIAYKLFVPVRIKIPLELAGAAAMVILIIYIYNTVQPMSKMAVAPSLVTERQKIVKKAEEESAELAFKEKKPAPLTPLAEDLSGMTVKKESEKPVEVALLIKVDEYKKKGRAVGVYEYDKLAQKTLEEQEKKLAEVPPPGAKAKVKALERREFKTADESALAPEEMAAVPRAIAVAPIGGEIAETPVAGGKDVQKRDELLLQYSNEILSGVKNLIELVQGKVISVEYEKDTNLPQFLNAEIPAANYSTFLEKLGQFGQVQGPLPSITTKLNEPIQVRIGLILSK